ncbi:hypothetical protein AKJ09_02007 [Labilithrix luteola]|uniref:IgGFc-binding protein N-terminal domain-containing protein n=1 Tax=Labilithrix luteola TaxID=1391654 RepID=A0A0K1PP92_9BACT|nr:hypothetical protein AKJ09_02007 [Labilithrix luteola]
MVDDSGGGDLKYEKLTGPLSPGGIAIVFLASKPGSASPCPAEVAAALSLDPIAHGTARTSAFHLTSTVPVSAYSMYPYGGAASYFPSATLLLPASSWSTNYLSINAWPAIAAGRNPYLQIVAAENDTVVRIDPNVKIVGTADVVGAERRFVQSWTLQRGQVLQFTQPAELTGSPIEATKPIGLFGGTQCTNVPDRFGFCDILGQQIPPVGQWGANTLWCHFARGRASTSACASRVSNPYRGDSSARPTARSSSTIRRRHPARPRHSPRDKRSRS